MHSVTSGVSYKVQFHHHGGARLGLKNNLPKYISQYTAPGPPFSKVQFSRYTLQFIK